MRHLPNCKTEAARVTAVELAIAARNYHTTDETIHGKLVTVRAIRNNDKVTLQEIFEHLSKESIYLRFFCPKKELTQEDLQYFSELDFERHVGIIVESMSMGQDGVLHADIAGSGRYIRDLKDATIAELALTVEDRYQRSGIGTVLIKHLSILAVRAGIKRFRICMLAQNPSMPHLVHHLGNAPLPVGKNGVVEFLIKPPEPQQGRDLPTR